jgi:serine/threonine protein kinase
VLAEARTLGDLRNTSIPAFHTDGSWQKGEKRYCYIVMDFMNMNLADLMKRNVSGTFSERTTLLVTLQMIRLLRSIHTNGYLHRDLKPENFLIGISEVTRRMIYIVDFGLAGKYL